MGAIYKCDKCGKIIKEKNKRLFFSAAGSGLVDEHGFPKDFYLCEECLKPFVKYLKRFLNIKKVNK